MGEVERRLRDRAAERRRVGWEISDAMTPAEMEVAANRIRDLEAALNDAYPFVCVGVDKWRRDNGAKELHPEHAELADRIARLIGSERLPSEVLKGK